ncbi:unnamed protein product [Allacma fusca]|uniref:Ig-like domain-containing protein n=1 Tax=Allacma fusca TaxID=39272 RepID=A0A8J2P7I0_9HEXA|nr:unnamed protein product [Allacma fusca]
MRGPESGRRVERRLWRDRYGEWGKESGGLCLCDEGVKGDSVGKESGERHFERAEANEDESFSALIPREDEGFLIWELGWKYSFLDSQQNNEPEFVDNIRNVTVPAGREAILSCVVSNLGKYKVGWIRAEDQTILTLDTKVVTHNSRVTVTHDGSRTWNLHLRQVRQNDRGCYMCQINTAIMKKRLGCIDVHVSPNIIDAETSSDITVREGDNATLVCRATGHPPPRIIWKREDGEKISMRRGFREVYKGYDNITGESLQFIRLDRKQMGTFLCIATNEVPPAVSKRITLDVNFAPMIKVPSQLLGAPFGTDVVLECHVESCPKAFIYWMKNRGEMLMGGLGLQNSTKYMIEETRLTYKTFVKLTVIGFQKKDVGIYNCMAANSMGKAEAQIRLHEIKISKSTSSATENQVVTSPGFATPPMSTEGKSPGKNQHPPDTLWTTYEAVAPRDSVASPRDPKSEVTRRGRDDVPASSASSTSNLLPKSLVAVVEVVWAQAWLLCSQGRR